MVEIGLRTFFPAQVTTIGRATPENARKYGWGFDPEERIVVTDPDTRRAFVSYANNHGWRDRDRTFKNPNDSFRIVVLGDSNTFGAIVPAEAVFTRLLEDRLKETGYNAEVINISLGGWGTDQELEALRLEGLRYKPDIIVLQFTTNDLGENHCPFGVKSLPDMGKPFCYGLTNKGELRRYDIPLIESAMGIKERAKRLISYVEILKRFYLVYTSFRNSDKMQLGHERRVSHKMMRHLRAVFGVRDDDALGRYLTTHLGEELDREKLIDVIDRADQTTNRDAILRLTEDWWFHRYLSPEDYHWPPEDKSSFKWRLLFKLLDTFRQEARAADAMLMLVSDNEQGHYEWERHWLRISSDEKSKNNYFTPSDFLREYSNRNGIEFVDSVYPHTRARNDPHPNVAGNQAMAENLFLHLIQNHRVELERHRLDGS